MKVLLFILIIALILYMFKPTLINSFKSKESENHTYYDFTQTNTTKQANTSTVNTDKNGVEDIVPNITNELDLKTMSDDINIRNNKGNLKTMSGDITVYNGIGNYETMSGDIELSHTLSDSVKTMSGDIRLLSCKCNIVRTMSGDISLTNSSIQQLYLMSGTISELSSNSNIEELHLAKTIQLDGIDIAINNLKLDILKKDKFKSFNVPSNVTIKKIYTDRNVVSSYSIEIIGEGKLILK